MFLPLIYPGYTIERESLVMKLCVPPLHLSICLFSSSDCEFTKKKHASPNKQPHIIGVRQCRSEKPNNAKKEPHSEWFEWYTADPAYNHLNPLNQQQKSDIDSLSKSKHCDDVMTERESFRHKVLLLLAHHLSCWDNSTDLMVTCQQNTMPVSAHLCLQNQVVTEGPAKLRPYRHTQC